MKNVTRREDTPGDTAQGTVCTKVLIKLLGLIGSCHRRKLRGKKVEMDPKNPGGMQVWKTFYGVAQSRTRLKRLSSSSSS